MAIKKQSILLEAQKNEKYHSKKKYFLNHQLVEKWYKIINQEVFKGLLPEKPEFFEIRRRHGCWAECFGNFVNGDKSRRVFGISLNRYMKSFRHFLKALAHEMVHGAQWLIYGKMDHGETFFEWKQRLAEFRIILTVAGGKKWIGP